MLRRHAIVLQDRNWRDHGGWDGLPNLSGELEVLLVISLPVFVDEWTRRICCTASRSGGGDEVGGKY